MNKLQTVSFWFKCYVLMNAVLGAILMFALWLLGKSENTLCRSIWNIIASEYNMVFLVLCRPFLRQKSFNESLKANQDRFASAVIELIKYIRPAENN